MTAIELRMFCESLPTQPANSLPRRTKEVAPLTSRPTTRLFAEQCGVSLTHLSDIMSGKSPLREATASKLLPVMRQYGFAG